MDEKRAFSIESLKHTPAWDELAAELEAAEEKWWTRYRAELKLGKELDQRELDYMRGKFDGIRQLLKQPERAARVIEKTKETDDGSG